MITSPARGAVQVGVFAVVVGVVLCIVYGVCIVAFGYASEIPGTMFWYADSRTYLAVSDWIASGSSTPFTGTRPFLYPLLILLPYRLAGAYGIWFLQAVMWLASGTMLFAAVLRLCRNIWIASGATLFFAANLTLMLLTLHALAEVTTAFLLCVGLVVVATGVGSGRKPAPVFRYTRLLLVAALLTVVKPVFLYVLIPMSLLQIFYLIGKTKGSLRRYGILLMLVAVSPVLIQVGIFKATQQRWGISTIGQQTLNRYMFSVLYSRVEQMPFAQARSNVKDLSLTDMVTYARRHFPEAVRTWATLVRINLTEGSAAVVVPGPHPVLVPYMSAMNHLYYCIHLSMIAPAILVTILLLGRKKGAPLERFFLMLWPVIVVFATSGLTFWQGDRIVVPVLPVWITLYAFVLQRLFREVRRGLNEILPARWMKGAGD